MQSPRKTGEHTTPETITPGPSTSEPVNAVPAQKRYGVKTVVFLLVLVSFIAAGGYWYTSNQKAPEKKGARDKAVPVTVAKAKTDSVPIEIRTVGNVLAFSVVNIQPQVGAQLEKVYFKQGDYVHKGDLLFQIDPRPYQATLEQTQGNVEKDRALIDVARSNLVRDKASVGQAQANLKKDQAQLAYARNEMARYSSLFKQGAVSQEQGEQMTTSAAQADATIQADMKAIENAGAVLKADQGSIDSALGTLNADLAIEETAKLNLSWCQIRSPIKGRTGSLAVYEGNIVVANNATPLVSIQQVEPIYIQFTLPEQNLDQIRRALGNNTLTVQALIEGEKTDSVAGTVSFLENTVNTSSGTISLRAVFTNSNHRLFPGQFVDVVVSMPPQGASVVVPASAVQISQQGNSVYVLKPNNTVDFVSVTMDRSYGDMAAISKGITAGTIVVVDGQLQLTPGAKVRVVKAGKRSGDSSDTGGDPAMDTSAAGGDSSPSTPTNAAAGANGTSTDTSTSTDSGGTRLPFNGNGGHHHRHGQGGGAPSDTSGNGAGNDSTAASTNNDNSNSTSSNADADHSVAPDHGSNQAHGNWASGGGGGHHHQNNGQAPSSPQ